MVEQDGRTLEQIEAAAKWAQGHEFWRANVMSMGKLREKFDQLRLQAQRVRSGGSANGNAEVVDMLRKVQGTAA